MYMFIVLLLQRGQLLAGVHRLLSKNAQRRDICIKYQIKCLSLQIQLANFRMRAGNFMTVDADLVKFVSNL